MDSIRKTITGGFAVVVACLAATSYGEVAAKRLSREELDYAMTNRILRFEHVRDSRMAMDALKQRYGLSDAEFAAACLRAIGTNDVSTATGVNAQLRAVGLLGRSASTSEIESSLRGLAFCERPAIASEAAQQYYKRFATDDKSLSFAEEVLSSTNALTAVKKTVARLVEKERRNPPKGGVDSAARRERINQLARRLEKILSQEKESGK